MATLYCTFNNVVGWRVVFALEDTEREIRVVRQGDRKYLRIPSMQTVRKGRFCNPVKQALTYVRHHAVTYRQFRSRLFVGYSHFVSSETAV